MSIPVSQTKCDWKSQDLLTKRALRMSPVLEKPRIVDQKCSHGHRPFHARSHPDGMHSAWQTVLVGVGLAASAAFAIAKLIG